MTLDLRDVAVAIASTAAPGPAPISAWSVDSRTIEPGALFFALRGPNHDGHAYLEQVFAKGAAAAVVERTASVPGQQLPVPDTLAALQGLAGWARQRWGGAMVAVTGSAGKTTTKDVIAALLASGMEVGKSEGNLNNHVGLPLSILRLPETASVAVTEIGMNHAGEIRALAAVARPTIGVVTNVGYAHIEYFNSIDEIALAKRELIEALPPAGVAVLNADDPRVIRFREVHPGRTVTFGLGPEADVRAEEVAYDAEGVRFRVGGVGMESRLAGRHGVLNILAGVAVAGVLGLAPERLRDAVRALAPGAMRGERFVHAGITILNDCYNSNPDAARAMLDVLRDTPARRRIAVLGEMRELGRCSETLHREIGRYAAQCGIEVLVGIRGAARQTVEAAIEVGLPAGAACFFETPEQAGEWLRQTAREGDAMLFKGSRGTKVEKALERFLG